MTSYRVVYECAGRREEQVIEADGWRDHEGWVELYRADGHPKDSKIRLDAPPIGEVLVSLARERVSLVQVQTIEP